MKAASNIKIIMIMVDGLGSPPEGWERSAYMKYCGKDFVRLFNENSTNIDACLGVEGIPQSATGQTSLFTGVNAAKKAGRHIQGFPGPELRKIIRADNMFLNFLKKGLSVCFANAYVKYGLKELKELGYRSVTTVMTECSLKKVLRLPELLEGNAVYHDLTRESLFDEFKLPLVTPQETAETLVSISKKHDLTLFEYFLSDRAGHKRIESMLKKHLGDLSDFLVSLSRSVPKDTVVLLTSDHGNCEDISVRQHTRNPVPLLILGNTGIRKNRLEVNSICDICNLANFLKGI